MKSKEKKHSAKGGKAGDGSDRHHKGGGLSKTSQKWKTSQRRLHSTEDRVPSKKKSRHLRQSEVWCQQLESTQTACLPMGTMTRT